MKELRIEESKYFGVVTSLACTVHGTLSVAINLLFILYYYFTCSQTPTSDDTDALLDDMRSM